MEKWLQHFCKKRKENGKKKNHLGESLEGQRKGSAAFIKPPLCAE